MRMKAPAPGSCSAPTWRSRPAATRLSSGEDAPDEAGGEVGLGDGADDGGGGLLGGGDAVDAFGVADGQDAGEHAGDGAVVHELGQFVDDEDEALVLFGGRRRPW